jgi:hypothetical protein
MKKRVTEEFIMMPVFLSILLLIANNVCGMEKTAEPASPNQKLFNEYVAACQSGTERTVLDKLAQAAEYRKNICWFSLFFDRVAGDSVANDSVLCEHGLRKTAVNDTIANLTKIKQALSDLCSESTLRTVLRNVLLFKTFELVTHKNAIKKLLDGERLDKPVLHEVATEAARYAIPEVIEYMIDRYPALMLEKRVWQFAFHNYGESARFKNPNPQDIWHEPKSLACIKKLHAHAQASNKIPHTLLHEHVRSIEPSAAVISWFLDNGYNPNEKNEQGHTALDVLYLEINQSDDEGSAIPSRSVIAVAQKLIQAGARCGDKQKVTTVIAQALNNPYKRDVEKNNIIELKKLLPGVQ